MRKILQKITVPESELLSAILHILKVIVQVQAFTFFNKQAQVAIQKQQHECLKMAQHGHMAVCQNLVPLVNIKIAGKWMFIPLKMVLIGIDPYPYYCGKSRPSSSGERHFQTKARTKALSSRADSTKFLAKHVLSLCGSTTKREKE